MENKCRYNMQTLLPDPDPKDVQELLSMFDLLNEIEMDDQIEKTTLFSVLRKDEAHKSPFSSPCATPLGVQLPRIFPVNAEEKE